MRLRTLGDVVLEGVEFTRPKPLLLLCYLALEGPQGRRFLAELFWPGTSSHMKNLSVTLTRLRKGAPGAIEADHTRAWTSLKSDAEQFLTRLEKREPNKALELYHGAFLKGFDAHCRSVELEAWLHKTRTYLAAQARHALLELAEQDAAQARFDKAAERAEKAYKMTGTKALEPEALHRLHLFLVASRSPQADILAREVHAAGLKTVSSPELAREQLSNQIEITTSPVPHNLPRSSTAFVGRDIERAEIATRLADPACRLLTLIGTAGVGKTRLAIQVAREQLTLGAFKDGIYGVSLAPLNAAEHLPSAIAEAIGLEPQGSGRLLEQIAHTLSGKETLLLLDNFEHIIDSAMMLAELMTACPTLTLLVTSRERLNLEGERIFPVTGLSFPTSEHTPLEQARRTDAITLFVERAKRLRPEFALTPDTLPALLKICHVTEGLPLALELAASWINRMSCQHIADDIERNLEPLTVSSQDMPRRHRSIQAAFEQSWRLLDPHEQHVLCKLTVFLGGFQRAAASKVAGATISVLASLIDKSLLRVTPTGRYTRHPLLYQYMKVKLAQNPALQHEARAKHAAHFAQLAEQCHAQLIRPDKTSDTVALKTLTEEHDNLRAALRWSLKHDPPLALRLAAALRGFWEFRGYLTEACTWLEAVLARPLETLPLRARFSLHTACGRFYLLRGLNERAQNMFESALDLAHRSQHPRDIAEACNQLGLLALEQQDFGRAESLCQRSLSLHRSHDNKRGVAVSLNNLGNIARAQGKHREAATHYQESLDLHRELGIHRSEAIALGNLGLTLRHLGEHPRAAKMLAKSITIRHELGDEIGLAHSFLGLAGLFCDLREYPHAATLLGVTERFLKATSVELALADRHDYNHTLAITRAALANEHFTAAWECGHGLATKRAVTCGLELAQAVSSGAALM